MNMIPAKQTSLIRGGSTIRIIHSQTIRQSHDYQSAEVSYGVELDVDATDIAVKKGMRRAERLVEDALAEKCELQRKLLMALAKNRQ